MRNIQRKPKLKKIKLTFFFLLLPAFRFAQVNTFEFNQSRYTHYKKIKTTGITLIITRVALNAGGIPVNTHGLKDSAETSDFREAASIVGKYWVLLH